MALHATGSIRQCSPCSRCEPLARNAHLADGRTSRRIPHDRLSSLLERSSASLLPIFNFPDYPFPDYPADMVELRNLARNDDITGTLKVPFDLAGAAAEGQRIPLGHFQAMEDDFRRVMSHCGPS
jgi:hypothetical protein